MVVLWELVSRITREFCLRPCRPESLVRLKRYNLPTQALKKQTNNLVIRSATSDPSKARAQAMLIHKGSRSKTGPRIWCVRQSSLKRPAKRFNSCLNSRMKKTTSVIKIQNSFQNNNLRKRRQWITRSLRLRVLQIRKLAGTWMPSRIRRPTWSRWTVCRRARNSRKISTIS